jgi:mRNA interferase RelE/StbE
MAFSVVYSAESAAILERLEPLVAKRILFRIDQAAKGPHHFFVRLRGSDAYKLRVGDYRVIATLDVAHEKVFIITLGHRKNIYD